MRIFSYTGVGQRGSDRLLGINNLGSKTASTVGAKSNMNRVAASYKSLIMMEVQEKSPRFMQWFSICIMLRN
jgi:hypothetical protein